MLTSKRLYVASLLVVAILAASLQGRTAHAAPCDWVPSGDDIYYDCGPGGNVGIGLTNPGEELHIGDGNILLEGGDETAVKIKRDFTITGPSGVSQNSIFEIGRIIQAGDGDPELRVLYSDDLAMPHAVFEVDRKGIVASVKQARGSHFEGFISSTDPEPIFRLNSFPKMRLEMGAGGSSAVDVAVQREAANTLTLITGATERLRVDPAGVKVSTGYLQLATSAGAPPQADCDNASEVGRMKVDASGMLLYVCRGTQGWGKVFLGNVYLPNISR